MSYPNFTAFKLRPLFASTTSSGGNTNVTVPFRGKYLYSVLNYTPFVSAASAWTLALSVNGSTTTADGVVVNPILSSSTTSTAAVSGGFNSSTSNSATLFVNQGDVLTTLGTSTPSYAIVHIVQEF